MKKALKVLLFLMGSSLFLSYSLAQDKDTGEVSEDKKDEVSLVCKLFPKTCADTVTGASNGGGNEPPIRKKKKNVDIRN